MDNSTKALLFAFAIQAMTELIDAIISLTSNRWTGWEKRGSLLKVLSFAIALIAVFSTGTDVVNLGVMGQFITALAVCGGTQGVNSLLKIGAYVKQRNKVLSGEAVPKVVEEGKLAADEFALATHIPVVAALSRRFLSIGECMTIVWECTPQPQNDPLPEDLLRLHGVDSPQKSDLFRVAVYEAMKERKFLVDTSNMPSAETNTLGEARKWLFNNYKGPGAYV